MTLIPNTYNGLVSAVKALAEDDSVEFENYIPTAIFMAEENLSRKLDTEGMYAIASVTATPGNNILQKPSGHRLTRDLSFRTSSESYNQPDMKTRGFIKDYWPVGKTSTSAYPNGQPKFYSNEDNNNWLLAPTPVSAYVFTVKYGKQVDKLSSSNQTNYYTSNIPEALFYGTMVGMSEFMKDYSILPVWQQRYEDSVRSLNNEGRRQRRDDGTVPNNPESAQNTLTGDD